MNDATLPGLIVPVEARITQLEKGLARANRAQRRAAQNMERRAKQSADRMSLSYTRAGNAAAAAFKRVALPLAAGVASAGTVRAIGQTTKAVAQLGDEAKRAGVPLKEFQEWKFVAEQNRIGLDAMIDSLKELNLRADEFIQTGKGPAAEAFARLSFTANELGRKLEDPSELLLEIFERTRQLDRAARIRVADEIFGGTGGERFVELMSRSEAEIRSTIRAAHEAGAVLDEGMIRKADELDRRFEALQARTSNFFKRFAVDTADAAVKIATLRTDIDDLFRSYDQARGLLGDGITTALENDSAAVDQHEATVRQLRLEYEKLADFVDGQTSSFMQAAATLRQLGYDAIADDLVAAASEMAELTTELDSGAVSADEFEKRLSAAATTAQSALNQIEAIDRAGFANVIAGVGGLITRLSAAAEKARELRAALPGATPDGSTDGPRDYQGSGANPGNAYGADIVLPQAPKTSPRPRLPSVDATFGVPEVSTGGGGGSGAGRDAFRDDVTAMQEEIALIIKEAEALNDLALTYDEYGIAQDTARRKAELLQSAQEAGKTITPELRREIDQVADSYADAAQRAEEARQRHENFQNAVGEMKGTLQNAFTGLITGASSFRDALGGVLAKLAEIAASRVFDTIIGGAGGGGGLLGGLLSSLGFSSGGFTGHGGKFEPAGVVHRGEFVISKEATNRIGVANLEALHSAAKRGYSGGGLVGGAAPLRSTSQGRSESQAAISSPITIHAPITVEGSAGTPEQNQDLAKKMSKELEGTMRGVVVDEIRKQQRPGNMLNNGRNR